MVSARDRVESIPTRERFSLSALHPFNLGEMRLIRARIGDKVIELSDGNCTH